MSMTGFRKQINKANQYVNEKVGGAKGTELDEEFVDMSRQVGVMSHFVDDVINRTHDILQPNPASRAKMQTQSTIAKFRGQDKAFQYPQPEGALGDCMLKGGRDLGDSVFGNALVETGEAFKQIAEVKYALEGAVKQNFLEPLTRLQAQELKEIAHHNKKLEGRRLDFDCKKRKKEKGGKVDDNDLRQAQLKFEDSKGLAEKAMFNLLENDVEQISQLTAFVDANIDYHRQALEILNQALEATKDKRSEAVNRPREELKPQRRSSTDFDISQLNIGGDFEPKELANPPDLHNGKSSGWSRSGGSAPPASQGSDVLASGVPCCKALFDFDAENDGELDFRDGEVIELTKRIDENWLEGRVRGNVGFFPTTYVEVIRPLP